MALDYIRAPAQSGQDITEKGVTLKTDIRTRIAQRTHRAVRSAYVLLALEMSYSPKTEGGEGPDEVGATPQTFFTGKKGEVVHITRRALPRRRRRNGKATSCGAWIR